MKNRIQSISIIAIALAILYSTFFLLFLNWYRIAGLKMNIVLFGVLFVLMLIGAIGVVFFKEWARKLLVWFNILILVTLSSKYILLINLVDFSFILISIIIIMYFSQEKIQKFFRDPKKKGEWKSILVVDDDETHIKMLRPILMNQGYSVLQASNGDDGLNIAINQKPDLVLLDVILPGIKGREVCKRIKENEETKHIPVIFITAKDSEEDIAAEKEVGGIAHLTKPINMKELLEKVKNVLEGQ